MSGNDEHIECPLCMEPLEIDDINFFPCTCGYQICRFCWHRIRTDENGLCPACRKLLVVRQFDDDRLSACVICDCITNNLMHTSDHIHDNEPSSYPEDPAKFNPLTDDELQKIKKERRQKDVQRKQKAAENKKHLANVRVVQRNLVFVVGLSQRLADPEVLKKHEYFGKFGKIHKVVINQSTSYAGAQGPSASAYVTYNKPDDALKAITAVNNVHADGRTLKASLGTTKYCSHFLKGTQCPKTDCMYLHELGEEAASFTKEEMQVGKHQEYEQKLLESYINSQNTAQNNQTNKAAPIPRKKASSPTNVIQEASQSPPQSQDNTTQQTTNPQNIVTNPTTLQLIPPHTANKDVWPLLQSSGATTKPNSNNSAPLIAGVDRSPDKMKLEQNKSLSQHKPTEVSDTQQHRMIQNTCLNEPVDNSTGTTVTSSTPHPSNAHSLINSLGNKRKQLGLDNSDNLSLFSSINGFHSVRNPKPPLQHEITEIPITEFPDSIPVKSSTDWQAALGFGHTNNTVLGFGHTSTSKNKDWQNDDDLGFDPLEESSRGLADLLEKENGQRHQQFYHHNNTGFSSRMPFQNCQPHSRAMQNDCGLNIPPGFSLGHIDQQSLKPGIHSMPTRSTHPSFTQADMLSSRMMNLMNPLQNPYTDAFHDHTLPCHRDHRQQQNQQQTDCYNVKDWQDGLRALLPNINISFGSQQQTDIQTNPQHSQAQRNANAVWPPQTHNPPPGFQTHRPPLQTADPHQLAEGLQ